MHARQFRQLVAESARHLGWSVCAPDPAAGLPDLILVRGARLLFAVLKPDGGAVSREQRAWLTGLRAGWSWIEAYEWQPADWDVIHATLERRERRAA